MHSYHIGKIHINDTVYGQGPSVVVVSTFCFVEPSLLVVSKRHPTWHGIKGSVAFSL